MLNRKMLLALVCAIVLAVGAAQVVAQIVIPFPTCKCDLNGDGVVSLLDASIFAQDYWSFNHPPRSDFDGDGSVFVSDIPWLAVSWGLMGCP